jgi:hypothetical protein
MGSGLITSTFFSVLNLLLLALTCFKIFAFVDAAIRPSSSYLAANKLTKLVWLLFLGIAALYDVKWGGVTQILTIVGTAAAIIYMVDVRPALKQYSGSSRRGPRDRRPDGPYGPW